MWCPSLAQHPRDCWSSLCSKLGQARKSRSHGVAFSLTRRCSRYKNLIHLILVLLDCLLGTKSIRNSRGTAHVLMGNLILKLANISTSPWRWAINHHNTTSSLSLIVILKALLSPLSTLLLHTSTASPSHPNTLCL